MKFEVRTPTIVDRVLGVAHSIARIPQRIEEIVGAARGLKDELRAYRLFRMHTTTINCQHCYEAPKDAKLPEGTYWQSQYYPSTLPACPRCKAPNPLHERHDGWTNPAKNRS